MVQDPHETQPDDDETITLTDEDGNEHIFEVVSVFQYDEKTYAVLVDVEEAEDAEAEPVILRVDKENDEDVLVEIEDDSEWDAAVAEWNRLVDEEEAAGGDDLTN